MFLTREQLEDMTGYKNHGKQVEWLAHNGYEFERRAVDGFPQVDIDEVRSRQLTYVRRPTRPDFSWMSEPARRATSRKPAKPASRRRTPTPARRAWLEANRARIAAHANNRRARRIHATPAWADLEAIAEFYRRAERLTRETGTRYVVDHVIPLQGERIWGLHVETNLRVITEAENLRKSNSFSE